MMRSTLIVAALICITTSSAMAAWIKRTDFGSHGRHRGTAMSIGNKGYMGLGHYNGAGPNIVLNDWWEYDPATNSWAQKADFAGNNGNGNYGVLSWSMSNYGFLAGGQIGGDNNLYRYDPSLNTWTAMANCPTVPVNREGFVIGDKGYYMSGNSLFEYNSITDTWTTKNPMPFSVATWNSAFSIGEKGYVKSNFSLYEYKPSIDAWTTRAFYPGSARAGSVALVQDGKGYIVAGYGAGLSDVHREVYEYDPATNMWDSLPEFPGVSRRFASGFVMNGRAYFGIGTNGTNMNDFWEFNAYLDLEEMFDVNQFTSYPNPASEVIHFKSENLMEFSIAIYDQMGRLVNENSTSNGKISFNKDNNRNGSYFYHILVDGNSVFQGQFIFN